MPNTQSAVNHHEYRSVPVAALIESASNPRKRFDDKSLEELGVLCRLPFCGLVRQRAHWT